VHYFLSGEAGIRDRQAYFLKDKVQGFFFGDLLANDRYDVGGRIVMVAALNIFARQSPVISKGGIGPGKAKGLGNQHFQATFIKFLPTSGDERFYAGGFFHLAVAGLAMTG
jgi:hypothetical protein